MPVLASGPMVVAPLASGPSSGASGLHEAGALHKLRRCRWGRWCENAYARVCVFCARDENSAVQPLAACGDSRPEGHVEDVVQGHDAANIMAADATNIMADLGLRTVWVQVLL